MNIARVIKSIVKRDGSDEKAAEDFMPLPAQIALRQVQERLEDDLEREIRKRRIGLIR